MNFSRTRRDETRVDMTPLIDIIFQLVLFFMVSTTFITAPGIQVDLPRSSSQTILRDKEDVNIWMTTDGAVYVDEQPVQWADLDGILSNAATRDTSTLVVIKADQSVDHGRVVRVMDLARGKGLSRLAIATDPGGGSSGSDGSSGDQ
ncbi:MAG: biopolymer transporter ExbD [Proteobacteria bacterium]|nr:biopolymer transporter ExbD [Pseudomonadota bacterium]MCP4921957.1 biopolymer transporter ExbD [Pseudomonadota bacterium]